VKKGILVAILVFLMVFCVSSALATSFIVLPNSSGTVNTLGDGGDPPSPSIMDTPSVGDGGGPPGPG